MTEMIPVVVALGFDAIRQIGLLPVADVEQVAEHRHGVALFTWPQQLADRHAKRFTQQVEQRGLQGRYRIYPQLKGPGTFAEGIKVSRLVAFVHTLNHLV